jgi:quinol monooxygenase YgiN
MLTLVAHPRCRVEMVRAIRSLMLTLPAAPGFISCRLYQEAEDANNLCYIEEWSTRADLNLQIRSSHYTHLLALMEESAEQPKLSLNWVTEVKGLEYLASVRLCDDDGALVEVQKGGPPMHG